MKRNLAFEWVRASTLRSTWGFPLLGIGLASVATVMFLVSGGSPDGGAPQATVGELLGNTANVGIVFTTVICAQAFGHEYRDGTMRLVLSEFPARSRVFLAKLVVPGLIVAVSVLVASAIITVLGLSMSDSGAGTSAAGLLEIVGRQVVAAVWWGLMVAAITALLRNLAAGIVFALVLSTIVETLLSSLLGSRLSWLDDVLPFTSAMRWASGGGIGQGITALVWVVALVGAAWTGFLRRDA